MAAGGHGLRMKRTAVWILLVAPAVFFYGATVALWTNLPIEDDYHGLLGFALAWTAASGWRARLLTLVSYQHNEYKLILINTVVALQLWGTHQLRLGAWVLLGDLLPLLCLYVLWRAMPQALAVPAKRLLFVPVVWLMLTLNYSEIMNWAMVESQMLTGTLLSLGCLYLLTCEGRRHVAWAPVLAVGACLANANAFLLAPIGVVLLWTRPTRRLVPAWLAGFALVLGAYLYRYQAAAHVGARSLGQGMAFFLAAVGCAVGYHGFYPPAVALGVVLVLGFGYASVRRLDRANAFAFWTAVFLLLTFALIAFGRSEAGVAAALQSRYRINSDLLLIALYLLGISARDRWPRVQWRRMLVAVAIPCVLIGVVGDALGLRAMALRRTWLLYGMEHYVASNGAASPMVYALHPPAVMVRPGSEEAARQTLNAARASGVYRIPQRY